MKAILLAVLTSLVSRVLADPNVVIIVADDMNRLVGHLGPELGLQSWAQPTPNIDKLAAKGVTFTNAHVCAPECKPSRTCLVYGESPVKTQVIQNGDDAGNPNVADKEHIVTFMKRLGYNTINYQRLFHTAVENVEDNFDVGVFNNGDGGYGKREPGARLADVRLTNEFDFGTINEPKQNHPDWESTEAIIGDMEKARIAGEKGFYALGFTACHTPLYIPKEIMDNVSSSPAFPPNPADDFDDIPGPGKLFGRSSETNVNLFKANPSLYTSFIRHYYGCIRLVDQMVGQIMDYVDNSPEEFIVIFTSDHGFHLVDKNRAAKFTLWSAVTQVPFVLYGGPFTGGKVIKTPVSLVDVYSTLAGILGDEPITHQLDGKDLIAIANGGGREPAVTYHKWGKAVIDEDWHLIMYSKFDYVTGEYPPFNDSQFELYKVTDPWQLENVADQFPEVIDRLKGVEI